MQIKPDFWKIINFMKIFRFLKYFVYSPLIIHYNAIVSDNTIGQVEMKYQTLKDLTLILSIFRIANCYRAGHVCILCVFIIHSKPKLNIIWFKNFN